MPTKCRFGFRPQDVVWTPLRRRAILTRYREPDQRWDAKYIAAATGETTEDTVLDPQFLRHAE